MSGQVQNTQINGSVYDAAHIGKKNELGQKCEFQDGRIFRYVSTAADLTVGNIVAVATAQAAEVANGIAATIPISTTEVTLDTTGAAWFGGATGVLAANKLADGYLAITDDAGEGYLYKIKSHTAGTASVKAIFTLYDGLKVALTTASDCHLISNKFAGVVQGGTALSPIGKAMVTTTASSDGVTQYFWVQTKGPAVCTGACTVGVSVATAASGAVADAAEAGSGAYDTIIGQGLATSSDGNAVVDLRLE